MISSSATNRVVLFISTIQWNLFAIIIIVQFPLKVPNICFFPVHLSCLSTLGISTTLIIDIGYKEATILPVSRICFGNITVC